jgi:hypothetical protein
MDNDAKNIMMKKKGKTMRMIWRIKTTKKGKMEMKITHDF